MIQRSGASNGSDLSNAFPTDLINPFGDVPTPPISLTGVSPMEIPALVPGTSQTVTLTGDGLLSVTQLMFFIPPFDIQIDPSHWTIVNDTTITVDMPQAIQLGSVPITVFDGQDFATINATWVPVSSPQLQLGTGDPLNGVDTDNGMDIIVAGGVGQVVWLFGSTSSAPSTSVNVNLDIGNNFSELIFLGSVNIGPQGYTMLHFTPSQLPNPTSPVVRFAQGIQLTLPIPLPVTNLQAVTFLP